MDSFISSTLKKYHYQSTYLLMILREIQAKYLYISKEAIELVAKKLVIPRAQITSVVEFYSFLHFSPRGYYDILLSHSITDLMLGQKTISDYLCKKLETPLGTVRADGLVSIANTSCTGLCDQGSAALINGYAIGRLNKKRIDEIAELIKNRIPVRDWSESLTKVDNNIYKSDLLLKDKITEGEALKAAFSKGLDETLTELQVSKLRGRGGAGFNTAKKWQFCRDAKADCRYVICNADEGEPGTFKDRVLLNTHAEQVFEGMTLCAAIVGAKKGFLYLRGEYLHLYDKLQETLEKLRQQGLLGENILNYGFDFDIEIFLGAGAYICGEESALIESMEGKPGIPRIRPPYPVTAGYLGNPTVIDNVETLLAATHIAIHGGQWFSAIGTPESTGTKLFSVSGDCERPGIYEYPFGVNVKEVLEDCGAKDVLGVQISGPAGVFISEKEFERKLAFEDLPSGGSFIIFNKTRNILEIVQNFSHFFAHESCGFCTPCREGTIELATLIDKFVINQQTPSDQQKLQSCSQLMQTASHCGLGQTAANPVLTTLARFPEIYVSSSTGDKK